MYKCPEPVCESIVRSQLTVNEEDIVQLQLAQPALVVPARPLCLSFGSLPFALYFCVAERSEAYAPSFKDDDFYRLFPTRIHCCPFFLRSPIASSTELALVKTRYLYVRLAAC